MEMVISWQLCRTIGPLMFHSQEILMICWNLVGQQFFFISFFFLDC